MDEEDDMTDVNRVCQQANFNCPLIKSDSSMMDFLDRCQELGSNRSACER